MWTIAYQAVQPHSQAGNSTDKLYLVIESVNGIPSTCGHLLPTLLWTARAL